MSNNPYKVMGLVDEEGNYDPSIISFDECKAAYQRLCLKYHPDKNRGSSSVIESNKKFLEVQGAWELIGSLEKKRNYDKRHVSIHNDITRSEEIPLSDFTKELAILIDECDETEKECWMYRKECRCGDFYEFTDSDISSGFNTTQCAGCSLYCTVTEV